MKTALLFIIFGLWTVCVMGQTPIQWAAIFAVRGICKATSNADDDLILKVRGWDYSSNDYDLKRYAFCIYRNLRLIDRDGNMKVETALQVLPEDTDRTKFQNAVNACKNQAGTDRYEKFYNFLKCYNVQYPKDIIAL